MTKRQSLKLLGEILLDRANFNVMTRYIANEANLKMMMNLLRDKSKNIQFEAFHVFKVSVAAKEPALCELTAVARSSWQTPRSHHRLRLFCGEIRRSSLCSCATSTMTKRVRSMPTRSCVYIPASVANDTWQTSNSATKSSSSSYRYKACRRVSYRVCLRLPRAQSRRGDAFDVRP